MPVFIKNRSHWTLLVCNLKRETWHFYNSMPNKTHEHNLRDVVYCLTRTYYH
ncbi:hypothetical protein KSP40_PGU009141 [Platanthera guangdongensis]|uniref:Ubiquitin-like protease family profile domain-containing protein n=1 Tax=Platanthera guangdongensis TaxID=2320717 RepID=A0ABR2N0K9_9ASPA